MINIHLERSSEIKPLYLQVYEAIKNHILDGTLTMDYKLPSKRRLAEHLNVSTNTITHAYEQLLVEGYIYTKERRGYYVEHLNKLIIKPSQQQEVLIEESVENKFESWLSFSHMSIKSEDFPFSEWLSHQRHVFKTHRHQLSNIPSVQGPYILRESIANMIAVTRGVNCVPEQIVIGSNTQNLLEHLFIMKAKNSVVVMEDPGFHRYYQLLKRMNIPVFPLKLCDDGLNIDELNEINPTFIHVTPSHQFPTGRIMPLSKRIELLNWLNQDSDRYIIEDDYNSEFTYTSDHIPSLQSLDRNNRVIYMGTLSTSLLPSFRLGYIVFPPALLQLYKEMFSHLIPYTNLLNLYTLHYFIQKGGYNRHIRRMTAIYRHRREVIINLLQETFSHQIKIQDTPSGLHFLATFKSTLSYDEVDQRAQLENLELYTMKRFILKYSFEDQGYVSVVIGFANISLEEIPKAIERLSKIFG